MTAPANLPDWLRPTPSATAVTPRVIRVAVLARTSTDDQQDPTLSIPRQFANCERALLPDMQIVLVFYDVESSRKELDQRGSSTAWRKFDIPVRRDGGIADLLAEATSPDRRFDVVMCESIDRIARFTYQGTKIEHDLELAGVPLLASDEPIIFDGQAGGRKRKRASSILLRRTKQGVAEWYIVEMLEKSWDGFETHTAQGWNVGKPPYGYKAERHKHPVPARRAEGKHKTKLAIDRRRGPVVKKIYAWRVNEKLSYRAIAERLNADLHRYPPPQPVDPERAVGQWTLSAVREILCNPKYTGHMAWNRRSTKDKLHPGKNNPVTEWVVSADQTHPELVSIETFLAAQNVAASRRRSRTDALPGTANRHPQTKRTYRLRSYIWCTVCTRRMWGRTLPREYTYYTCHPRDREIPDGHPRWLSLDEDKLLDLLTGFFNSRIFGPERIQLVSTSANIAAQQTVEEHQQKIKAVQYALTDIATRQKRLFKILEENDDEAGTLYQQAKQRQAELDTEHARKVAELDHLERTMPPGGTGAIDLLDHLPETTINLADLPAERLRPLLDAFAVQLHYNLHDNSIKIRATVSAESVPHIARLAHNASHRYPITAHARGAQHPHSRAITSPHTAVPADDGGDSRFLRIYDMPRPRSRPARINSVCGLAWEFVRCPRIPVARGVEQSGIRTCALRRARPRPWRWCTAGR
jgi:site-specific DNA recombinase